ncbi:hypothetical protein O9993_08200 [Vibrio lentus]|nr:hypothetical protein [Vibrio lentus]
MRISKAKKDLLKRGHSVTDVCMSVGYEAWRLSQRPLTKAQVTPQVSTFV